MKIHSLKPNTYWPTAPRCGSETRRVFRMRNMILRGTAAQPYAEVYSGSRDLGEDIATADLTGTVATVAASTEVVGAGTAFTTELHLGQFLEIWKAGTAVRIPMVVDEIIDDTHFHACRPAESTLAAATATRFPRIFEMNKKRGTLQWGNAIEVDKGTIVAVGDGTLRLNGVPLPGTSLVATRSPKIALFDPTTGNYTVFTLGMATPATLTAAAVAGGTKNMQAGVYSVRAVPARIATRGYNNPSPKAEVTIATGDKIRATLPAADTVNGQDAWMFFVTLILPGAGIQGPWFRYELPEIYVPIGAGAGEIPAAGGTYDIEYNDAEVSGNDLLTFNNDAPPDAEFVMWMAGLPVYLSCLGPGETSPGPFIAAGKPRNVEAVPPTQYVSTSPPDTIISGLIGVQGRLYLQCVNSLQIALATQAQDARIPAFAVRPFWKSGFLNAESLISTGDNLIGMTTNGLAKSISEGDEGSEEYGFATAVEELTRNFHPGHCLLKVDPKNNAVALFMSGYSLNADGFWTTRVLLYGLREAQWIGDVILTSTAHDMIVCSAATINGQLEFLCGGRTDVDTTVVHTYRWDDPTANESIPWQLTWQFGDDGAEDRPKAIKALRVTGQFSDQGELAIFGVSPGLTIDVGALEAFSSGLGPTFPDAINPTQYNRVEWDQDNLMQWTVRAQGVWPGAAVNPSRDRIDEVVVETILRGARR